MPRAAQRPGRRHLRRFGPREFRATPPVTHRDSTGAVWVICDAAGLNGWWSAGISFVIGFTFRVAALYRGWEAPLAKEPQGVYRHSDGRPLLGRKLAGKSKRELTELGLHTDSATSSGGQAAGT